ncbi:uncharacterized protein LOC123292590 [Chrysoperla carnea]|uniref:uncharacterized protein LOC123292590 n=1 Tax=Chrysoperla carnea TaxID=189513 RepID=UPI001D05C4F1|nr:uncharacterized protein LOC123292590 [Chrysoperla carnea]
MKEQHKVIQKILINSLLSNKRQINGKILHNKKEKFLKDINSPQSSSKSKTKEESTDHKCESSWDNFIQPFFKNKSKVKSVSTTKNLIKSFGLIQTKLLRGDAILDNVKLRKYDKYGKLVKDCDQDYTNSCSSGATSNKIPKIKSEKNENKTFANKNMNVSVEMKKKTPKLGMGDNTKKRITNLTPKPNIDPIRYPKIVNPLSVIIPIEQNLNKRKLKRRKYVPKSRDSTLKPKTGSDVMKSDTKSVSGDKRVKSTPSPTIKKTQVLPLNVIHKKRNTKNNKIGKDNNSKNSQIGNNSNTKDKESEQQLDKIITPYISNTKLQNNIIIEKIESDNYNKNINWRTDIRKSRPRSAGRKVESVKSSTLNNHITENNIYRNMSLRIAASPYERKIHHSGQIQIKPEIKMARYGKYINEVLDGRDIIAESSQIICKVFKQKGLK